MPQSWVEKITLPVRLQSFLGIGDRYGRGSCGGRRTSLPWLPSFGMVFPAPRGWASLQQASSTELRADPQRAAPYSQHLLVGGVTPCPGPRHPSMACAGPRRGLSCPSTQSPAAHSAKAQGTGIQADRSGGAEKPGSWQPRCSPPWCGCPKSVCSLDRTRRGSGLDKHPRGGQGSEPSSSSPWSRGPCSKAPGARPAGRQDGCAVRGGALGQSLLPPAVPLAPTHPTPQALSELPQGRLSPPGPRACGSLMSVWRLRQCPWIEGSEPQRAGGGLCPWAAGKRDLSEPWAQHAAVGRAPPSRRGRADSCALSGTGAVSSPSASTSGPYPATRHSPCVTSLSSAWMVTFTK